MPEEWWKRYGIEPAMMLALAKIGRVKMVESVMRKRDSVAGTLANVVYGV